jgi:tetratricopeptide (TPR) repeat protein
MPWAKPPPKKKRLVTPADADQCPCGSGATYAACCKAHLPGFNQSKAYRAAMKAKDLDAALVAARADFTQYAIWHATNTAPAMRAGVIGIKLLIDTDIQCLSGYADQVAETLYHLGRKDETPAMLEHLRPLVDDLRWPRKVLFLQAHTLLKATGDEAAARREFKKLGPLSLQETDVEILRLGIGLLADERSMSKTLKLCDRILALSEDLDDQLRFRSVKATQYLLHGDEDEAAEELEGALALDFGDDDAELDHTTQWTLSWILKHLGVLRRDPAIFHRAKALLDARMAHPHLTDHGKAAITEDLADLLRTASQSAEAEAAYRAAIAIEPSARAEIFLAQVISFQGRAREADDRMRAIETAHLNPNEYEDYVLTLAGIAVQLGDRDALIAAEARLRGQRSLEPYFEQRRLKLLVAVTDAIAAGASAPLTERVRKLLATPVRSFNRYIMAEPNIAGMGVRVNNILEDLTKTRIVKPYRKR